MINYENEHGEYISRKYMFLKSANSEDFYHLQWTPAVDENDIVR